MNRTYALRTTAILLGTAAAVAPLAGVVVHALSGPRGALSAALGAGLATLLALVGTLLQLWALPKSQRVFMTALVSSLLGRMAIFSGAIVLLVVATKLPPAPFLGGLFLYYVICQVLEIRAVQQLGAR